MAYFSQERKKELAPLVKEVLAKYGVKASLSVKDHQVFVVTMTSGVIDFVGDYIGNPNHFDGSSDFQVNQYWLSESFKDTALEFLTELKAAMNTGNWDKSDSQTDYFNVGWYTYMNIGKYSAPYVCTRTQVEMA